MYQYRAWGAIKWSLHYVFWKLGQGGSLACLVGLVPLVMLGWIFFRFKWLPTLGVVCCRVQFNLAGAVWYAGT